MYKYLLLATLGVMLSCNNDDDDSATPTTDYLVIGDSSADVSLNSTINLFYSKYDPEGENVKHYEFDLDDDGIDDFRFDLVDYPSITSGFKKLSIRSLHTNALFISNDSIVSPEILNEGDTLRMTNNAIENTNAEEGAMLYEYSRSGPLVGGGSVYTFGLWPAQMNKNIGLMVKKNNTIVYGWTEVSLTFRGLYIQKIASKPCLY